RAWPRACAPTSNPRPDPGSASGGMAHAELWMSDDRPADRRVATALFADISGFTALAHRLDPESLHEVVAPVISALASVAERHGGFIAKYAGDALLVLFGVPDPEPDHADRAVRAAAEMHAELARLLPELPGEAS